MEAIERAIIASVLLSDFSPEQKQILEYNLDHNMFNHGHNRFFVRAINKLKQLDLPTDETTLYAKLADNNVMTMQMQDDLSAIISSNPLGTLGTFKQYISILNKDKKNAMQGLI
jgi:hypothetical protein